MRQKKRPPVKIRIPKVDPTSWVAVDAYKSKYITIGAYTHVYLKRQTIAGLEIPKDTVIQAPSWHIHYDEILGRTSVLGVDINIMLRYIFFMQLRTRKKI